MTSPEEENDESETPGVKKRSRPEDSDNSPEDDASEEEEGVVRAPEAPTTAPNAPRPDASSEGPGKRRVVDPSAQPEQEASDGDSATDEDDDEKDEVPAESTGMKFGDSSATMDDFAAMLDGEEDGGVPDRRRFEVGDTVDGEVVEIGKRYVFVDIGRPQEGYVDRAQLEGDDEDAELELEVGDRDTFYVLGFADGVELGRELGAGSDGNLEAVEKAYSSGVPISGAVKATNKGGFEVEVAGLGAFCPISRIELGYTDEPEIHVGNTYRFLVDEIEEDGRTIVLDRKELLAEEQKQRREEVLENLEVGDEIEGVVTRVADFGAFVDIGGVEGLVHVSEMSHAYFDDPSAVVQSGDNVDVEVLDIEEPDDGDDGDPLRISLSMKKAADDPWMEVNDEFAVGQTVMGTIVRLAPFGAFVELLPGVEGLVHVSEMSRTEHVATPGEVVDVGDEVQIEIQDIDVMNRRISLSMAATEDDPWNAINERFAVGMETTGTVANIEDFGAFIDLEDGITALLPRSEMDLPSEITPHRKFSRGEEVTARVLNIEPERKRMALTLKDEVDIAPGGSKPDGDSSDSQKPRSYTDDGGDSSRSTLGTLGDLLQSKKDDSG